MSITATEFDDLPPMDRPWLRSFQRFLRHRLGVAGTLFFLIVLVMALFPDLISPFAPQKIVAKAVQPPSVAHLFGTDEIGRDIFTRVVFSARVSLQIVLFSVLGAAVAGTALGLIAGYTGGFVDTVIMRIVDAIMAFPFLIFALAIVAVLGPEIENAILAIAIAKSPGFVRLVRSEVLTLRSRDFVKAAVILGASDSRIIRRHLLPNVMGNLIVYASLSGSTALITESSLSFLGLGVRPPTPSWGYMISVGMDYWQFWWMSVFPGMAIFLTVLSMNFMGDALRDALDSRLDQL